MTTLVTVTEAPVEVTVDDAGVTVTVTETPVEVVVADVVFAGASGLPLGLTGATAATRYVGGTSSGAPVSGTFAVGDYVVTADAKVWVCTVAGSPGSWSAISGGGGTGDLLAANNLSDLANAATARTNLGLGTAATHAHGDYETAGAAAAAQAASQPLDSDLTAIAALSTTSYGRAFLALADAAAGRTALGLGTAATTAASAYEVAGAAAAAQAAAIAASQPVDSDLTAIAALTTTSFGRSLLTQADAAATRTTLGLGTAATSNTTAFEAAGTVATHEADTTSVHGITDTSTLYRSGGTDVAVTDGGTGASTAAGARTNLGLVIGTDVQAYDAALTTLGSAFSSLTVPRRSLNKWRGGPEQIPTTLSGSMDASSGTVASPYSVTVSNGHMLRLGYRQVFRIDNEEILVERATSFSTTWSVIGRGVNGTTAATHASGALVQRSKVRNVVIVGDSTAQATTSSSGGPWDAWPDRIRRVLGQRFGGSLGGGFYPMWRNGTTSASEWSLVDTGSGSWASVAPTVNYDLGPFAYGVLGSGGTSSDLYAVWTRPAGERVQQIDVYWLDLSTNSSWSYSTDGGSNWVANPNAATNPATPTLKVSRILVSNPTDFRVRPFTAAGTASATVFVGIDTWSTANVVGTTEGVKVHNLGRDSMTLARFVRSNTWDDLVTTSGSTTATSATATFASTDTGKTIQNANVPQGTTITYVSATQITLSAAATATVAAGTSNPFTIQGGSTVSSLQGDWARLFDGDAASLTPDLIVVMFTNDMMATRTFTGAQLATAGARDVTGSITSNVLTVTSGALTAGDTGRTIAGTGITAGTTITYTDSTHAAVTHADVTSRTIQLGAQEATINISVAHNLTTLLNRVYPYADVLVLVPFEQGSDRLTGDDSTAAKQASYRAAMSAAIAGRRVVGTISGGTTFTLTSGTFTTADHGKLVVGSGIPYNTRMSYVSSSVATLSASSTNASGVTVQIGVPAASVDLYSAWAAEGNTGYAAAAGDELIDLGDATGYHVGDTGHRDIASRVTRLLEVF